jgi:hypothetical protein
MLFCGSKSSILISPSIVRATGRSVSCDSEEHTVIEPDRISTFVIMTKVIIVVGMGILSESIFEVYPIVAYEAGLLVGVLLQSVIPPRSGWKQTLILSALVFVLGQLDSQ